jgi:Tfp pilus assembly protein PilN
MKRIAILAIAVLFVALCARWQIGRETQAQLAESAKLRAALAELHERTRELDAERPLLQDLLGRKRIVEVFAEDSGQVAAALAELSRMRRPVVLERVSVEGRRLRLAGRARTADELVQLQAQLEGSGLFARVGVAELQLRGSQNMVAFALSAELKPRLERRKGL